MWMNFWLAGGRQVSAIPCKFLRPTSPPRLSTLTSSRILNFDCRRQSSFQFSRTNTLYLNTTQFLVNSFISQLFGRIDLSDDWSKEINHHNNFRSFLMALQVLFRYVKKWLSVERKSNDANDALEHVSFFFRRASTGENWHKIMLHCFDDAKCDEGVGSDKNCGSTVASVIYFCTFYFFCTFLVSSYKRNTGSSTTCFLSCWCCSNLSPSSIA